MQEGDVRCDLAVFATSALMVGCVVFFCGRAGKEMARTDDGEQAEEPWPETEKGRADAREDAKGLQSK